MRRITLTMDNDLYDALASLAEAQRRPIASMGVVLIERALGMNVLASAPARSFADPDAAHPATSGGVVVDFPPEQGVAVLDSPTSEHYTVVDVPVSAGNVEAVLDAAEQAVKRAPATPPAKVPELLGSLKESLEGAKRAAAERGPVDPSPDCTHPQVRRLGTRCQDCGAKVGAVGVIGG